MQYEPKEDALSVDEIIQKNMDISLNEILNPISLKKKSILGSSQAVKTSDELDMVKVSFKDIASNRKKWQHFHKSQGSVDVSSFILVEAISAVLSRVKKMDVSKSEILEKKKDLKPEFVITSRENYLLLNPDINPDKLKHSGYFMESSPDLDVLMNRSVSDPQINKVKKSDILIIIFYFLFFLLMAYPYFNIIYHIIVSFFSS